MTAPALGKRPSARVGSSQVKHAGTLIHLASRGRKPLTWNLNDQFHWSLRETTHTCWMCDPLNFILTFIAFRLLSYKIVTFWTTRAYHLGEKFQLEIVHVTNPKPKTITSINSINSAISDICIGWNEKCSNTVKFTVNSNRIHNF